MRQPTFFAHAWPRFDHHVYCSGRGSTRRNTSTQPSLSNTSVSHARSSGRNPEFFRFERQFLVDLLVGDVPVATENEFAAARLELLQHRHELPQETELGLLPFLRARPGR